MREREHECSSPITSAENAEGARLQINVPERFVLLISPTVACGCLVVDLLLSCSRPYLVLGPVQVLLMCDTYLCHAF